MPEAAMREDELAEATELRAPIALATPGARVVLLRLIDGEQIELGSVGDREAALDLAQEAAHAVDSAAQSGSWPEFGERFVRPGAIVSIDVRRG